MFETELHRWLQTFNAPAIEYFMRAVSVFGEEEFYALLMLGVIFGVDRRKGFLLTQVLLWASLTTALLKHAFALPRPVDVDTLVKDITGERNCPSPFVARGASGFFDLLPPDVVAYFRAQPHISYGFPSGHCSSSVATCGSAAILFRRSWLIWATTGMIILMPISRMYLGRHFLADVLGGLVLGLLFILAAIIIERKAGPEPALDRPTLLSIVFKFLLPAGCILAFPAVASEAAMLLGVNLGQALTAHMLPAPMPQSIPHRLLSILMAALAFFGTAVGLALLATVLFPAHPAILSTIVRILAPCVAIGLATEAGIIVERRRQSK
jgi:membrane-associated phospholipid phosphatase